MRRLRNGITALLFVVTCSVAACGAPTCRGQSPSMTAYAQPTVQVVTPTANQQLDANRGGVIAVPLDATAAGAGPLTFS